MSATSIEWATDVWNPFTGCDRVSPGCAHCYALEYAARLKAMGQSKYQVDGDPKSSGPGFGFTVHEDVLDNPPQFKPGARVFVNSMSDVFHEDASDDDIGRLWVAMAMQPDVNFLILTKRAARMAEEVPLIWDCDCTHETGWCAVCRGEVTLPLPNVWLGVSIENRRFVHRADLLRQTPAAVRFISAEPLLGPLIAEHGGTLADRDGASWADGRPLDDETPELDLTGIDWLIVGAESGAKRRRFDVQWARDLRDATQHDHDDVIGTTRPHDKFPRWAMHGTAFFFKQGSAHRPGQHRELDRRTWDELPMAQVTELVG